MKRFIVLLTLATLMVITAGAVRTPAQNYYGYNVDNDYGGELPDGTLITVRFLYNDDLMYEAVAAEEELDYTITTISDQMPGQLLYHESTEELIIYYYGETHE